MPFQKHGIRLCRVLTDGAGSSAAGAKYELNLAVQDIDHSRTKDKSLHAKESARPSIARASGCIRDWVRLYQPTATPGNRAKVERRVRMGGNPFSWPPGLLYLVWAANPTASNGKLSLYVARPGLAFSPPMRLQARMDISIVIPVYNEVEALPSLYAALVETLDRLNKSAEIIFANDGSTDGSGPCLDDFAAKDPRVRVLHLSRNYGQTAALMAAIQNSS